MFQLLHRFFSIRLQIALRLLYMLFGQSDGITITIILLLLLLGPGSVVGIATGYGLDGPGMQSRWGRDFLHLSRTALGPTQPPIQWLPGLSRG